MESLCKSLIAAFVFLELSGDDVVDPDSAMTAAEGMAAELQGASLEERTAFIRVCEQEAAAGKSASRDQAITQFVAGLPYSIGLIDDEA
ncbi:hypothetical protein KWH04_20155 [Xanthomonas campestris pv. trichodesmae]|uniref:Uncharacterized protein n=2 Tax=Xanthomonas citri TaxID=346 RepID=A0AB33CVM6_XANCI|nr:hypothetical protein [Xanthomonas citri]MBV6782904.1 hypothetical protein [Xanthomonas campestris pv. trichodesmae]MBV6839483.1 hypothetical protein [Xanthomonas campestris pv. merremiae]ASK94183.1 hypothetical protein XcvCFBP7111P_24230 [Xanthomonas citri pv. vignicola]ASK98520.1 hypothetical protein XcvCFBP7112P_21955 [Xanthomonas citri pv. vignicola]MBZ3920042.1 hypothetical protein [Xanthomonas campestris pv. trichodesmae]